MEKVISYESEAFLGLSPNSDEKKNSTQGEVEKRVERRKNENNMINRIVKIIITILVVLLIIFGFLGYRYFKTSLEPLDPNSKKEIAIEIPINSSNKKIAAILEKNGVIKSAMVFNYYVKTNNETNFQAGHYELKPSMTFQQIIKQLKSGASSQETAGKVLVKEGVTIDQIGDTIAASTEFKKADFLKLMKDEPFLKKLAKKYPDLLASSMAVKDVRYHLEGYLYPATYDVYKNMTLEALVTTMVGKTDDMLTPLIAQIQKKKMTVQEVLALASLVEREGVTEPDRREIAGVFFNRIDVGMPLQSDISILYALNTHKENVTYKDLEVNSPYNLYKNKGYGPGAFNSPSIQSIQAVLNPTDRAENYLYFIADLKTGKVYFSKTLEEHNQKDASISAANASSES